MHINIQRKDLRKVKRNLSKEMFFKEKIKLKFYVVLFLCTSLVQHEILNVLPLIRQKGIKIAMSRKLIPFSIPYFLVLL